MISLEEALRQVLSSIEVVPAETLPLAQAQGRVLRADLASPSNLPLFDNSAMDGYAVRSDDLQAAAADRPVVLRMVARIPAGKAAPPRVGAGQCARIFTGSPLPPGADAVVMQEDVSAAGEEIRFSEPVRPFENVRLRGEDVRAGSPLARAGETLTAARASVLAACGVANVAVSRRPVVALLATGSELREPGEAPGPGEIYESNRALLQPLLEAIACETLVLPIVRDDLEGTVAALGHAFSRADAVITTGGVSVGELDFVKEALQRIGGGIDLWRVAIRPGKPFVFGRLGPRRLFGLPGNPVSALVTFLLLVRPALLAMQGSGGTGLPRVPGRLAESVHNPANRRHFMRVRWENGEVSVCGPQASHLIGSLARANGLIDVPPAARLEAGAEVQVQLWQW